MSTAGQSRRIAARPRRGRNDSNSRRYHEEYGRRSYIEKFLPHIGIELQEMLALSDAERDAATHKLDDILLSSRVNEGA